MIGQLIQRTKAAVNAFQGKSVSDQNRFFRLNDFSHSTNFRNSKDYLNAYRFVSYVGQAVSIVSQDIAALAFEILDENGNELKNVEINDFLKLPMEGVGYSTWMGAIVIHLLLDGNAFLLRKTNNALSLTRNTFDEAAILNPSLVEVINILGSEVRSTRNTNISKILEYRINLENNFLQVPAQEVQKIILVGPHNLVRGMGKIQQNATLLDADRFSSIFNSTFFEQGAIANIAVSPGIDMGQKQQKLFEDKLREDYEGQENWNKIMVLPKDSTVKTFNLSHKDMEFIKQKKMTRQDVFGIFQVPPIISGIMDDAKYDSADEQKNVYYGLSLPRLYAPIENGITNLIKTFDKRANFRIVKRQTIDQEKQNAIARDMFDRGAITANEYREMLGKPIDRDNSSLNTHFISFGLVPLDSALSPTPQEEKSIGAIESSQTKQIGTKASARQLRLHRQATNTKKRIEKEINKSIIKFYKQMEIRALEGLEKTVTDIQTKDANINDVFDFSEEKDEAIKSSRKFFTSASVLALNDFNSFFNADIDTTFGNQQIRLVVEKLSVRYADLTINSRREELRKILEKAVSEGLAISEIKVSIQQHFQSLIGKEGWRATRIARTEASYAWDQAAGIGYKEIGVTQIDVVGCEESHQPWDCNLCCFPLGKIDTLNFHPNHTGTVVPNGI
jgi:HK97 family phage portal protein